MKPLQNAKASIVDCTEDMDEEPETSATAMGVGLICALCKKAFLSKQSLSQHMMRHLGTLPYSCHLCNYQGVRKGRLKQHIRTNHGEHEVKNAVTTPSATTTSTLAHQLEICQLLSCSTCNKEFTSKQALSNHMKQHSGEKSFACPHCSYAAFQKVHLDSHILRRHATREELEGTLACPKCPRILSTPDTLKYHLLIHEESKPFPCTFCDKAFRGQKFLTRHLRLSHANEDKNLTSTKLDPSRYYTPKQCSICNKTLSNQYTYNNHMSRHARSLQCHKCNKTFSKKLTFTVHLKRHAKEKSIVKKEKSTEVIEETSDFIVGL